MAIIGSATNSSFTCGDLSAVGTPADSSGRSFASGRTDFRVCRREPRGQDGREAETDPAWRCSGQQLRGSRWHQARRTALSRLACRSWLTACRSRRSRRPERTLMFVNFFIRRPVFATVCSLLIILAGADRDSYAADRAVSCNLLRRRLPWAPSTTGLMPGGRESA